MKLGKLSLVAVMALGTSAFAIENVKVNGDVKMIYQTSDTQTYAGETADTGLFDNGDKQAINYTPYNAASAGGITARLGLTADLLKSVSAGAEVQIYSSLGLDKNLFNDNMINAGAGTNGHSSGGTAARTFDQRAEDASNMSQLWLATTTGKTTLKAGRMELDTPFLFTEKWNLAYNTFEGAVAVNEDLPNTTLVAAWVGKHNGHGVATSEGGTFLAGSPGRTVSMDSFNTFWNAGAYAAGAINKSIPNTTAQAWYYNIVHVADAFWLQADTKVAGMVSLGGQYAMTHPEAATSKDSNIWAVKAGVDVMGVNLYGAYSSTDNDGTLGFSNTGTGDKTKIYTGEDSIYFDGVVTGAGIDTYKIGAKGAVAGVKLAAAYINCENILNETIDGFDFSASTNVGQLGLTAIYTIVNNGQSQTTATAPSITQPFYSGRDIETLRLVASLKF